MVPRLWWLLAVFWSRCLGLTSTSMIRPRQYRLVLRSTACYSSTTPNHEDDPDLAPITDQNHSMTLRQRLRGYIRPRNNDDELSFRQRLGKMGLACMLSYGWISNLSVGVCVSASWYVFSKKTGLSPLAPDQWKGFLAVYAGFYLLNNIVRPARLALSVAVAPRFDRFIIGIQERLRVNKTAAIAVTVVLANVVGTTLFMALGIVLASLAAGVPIVPPKV